MASQSPSQSTLLLAKKLRAESGLKWKVAFVWVGFVFGFVFGFRPKIACSSARCSHLPALALSLSLLTVALCARAHCERVDVGKGSKLSRDIKSWLAIWPGRIFISTLCATSCLSLSASVECSQSRVDQAAAVHPITDPIRSECDSSSSRAL